MATRKRIGRYDNPYAVASWSGRDDAVAAIADWMGATG
jgi:hypothetical protein